MGRAGSSEDVSLFSGASTCVLEDPDRRDSVQSWGERIGIVDLNAGSERSRTSSNSRSSSRTFRISSTGFTGPFEVTVVDTLFQRKFIFTGPIVRRGGLERRKDRYMVRKYSRGEVQVRKLHTTLLQPTTRELIIHQVL